MHFFSFARFNKIMYFYDRYPFTTKRIKMNFLSSFFACGDMCDMTLMITALIGGYLSGSIPYGLIIGRLSGIGDIRKSGSGNIGATNMLRQGGKKLAILTLLADMLKGLAPVVVASAFGETYGLIAALGAVFGHLFPIWLKFKGGKGVATSIGVFIGIAPFVGLIVCVTWIAMAYFFRISSLAALVSIAAAPVIFTMTASEPFIVIGFIIAVCVWIRHQANIRRLLAGTEPKIGKSKNKPDAKTETA